jgi:stalled ribosome alternative rescue factor ArfA
LFRERVEKEECGKQGYGNKISFCSLTHNLHKDCYHRHEEEMYKMVIANLEERQKVNIAWLGSSPGR